MEKIREIKRKWSKDTLLQEEAKGSIVIEDIDLDPYLLHEDDIQEIGIILKERYLSKPIPQGNYPNQRVNRKERVYKGNDY